MLKELHTHSDCGGGDGGGGGGGDGGGGVCEGGCCSGYFSVTSCSSS